MGKLRILEWYVNQESNREAFYHFTLARKEGIWSHTAVWCSVVPNLCILLLTLKVFVALPEFFFFLFDACEGCAVVGDTA